jgi:hypothetical protein
MGGNMEEITPQDVVNILIDNDRAVERAVRVLYEKGQFKDDHTKYADTLYDWIVKRGNNLTGTHKDRALRLVLRYLNVLVLLANEAERAKEAAKKAAENPPSTPEKKKRPPRKKKE